MSNTASSQQLNFLQEKIREIGSAIFFNESDSVLKLPTSLVTTLKVDDYGYVWFFIQKPKHTLQEFEKEFPVKLDFYKKGTSYFLQVTGKGWVVDDPEEVNGFTNLPLAVKQMTLEDMVLVKVKIGRAEYYETGTTRHSWWTKAVSTFTTWFRSGHYRPNVYSPAS